MNFVKFDALLGYSLLCIVRLDMHLVSAHLGRYTQLQSILLLAVVAAFRLSEVSIVNLPP